MFYSILLKFVYKFVIIKKGVFFGLLGFDDDFTLNKQMCFRDCFVEQYPILLKIVDEAYDLVHGSFYVSKISKKLDKEDHLEC